MTDLPAPAAPLSADEARAVAVVIPALDEAPSIGLVLASLPALGAVLVVDNGSRDDTAAQAASAGATVLSEPRRGYGNAVQAGLRHLRALAHPPVVVVILDADKADDPAYLPNLVRPILDGAADLVLSDRTGHAAPGALLPHQRLGNRLATALIRLSTGHRYADMGPFRALRLQSAPHLGLSDPTYGWNVEMQMRAVQAGLRVLEVPVPYHPRLGRSKISGTLRGSLRAGARIIGAVWTYR